MTENEIKKDTELYEEDEKQDRVEELEDGKLCRFFPDELVPNEINEEIYGNEGAEEDFVESMRINGQITPIIIDQYKNVVSGCMRRDSLIKINEERLARGEPKIKAICLVRYFFDNDKITENIIEANRSREKTPLMECKESKKLREIYAEAAEQRRLGNLTNVKIPKYVEDLNSVHRVNAKETPGRTIDKLAEEIGTKRDTLTKKLYIFDRAEAGDPEAIEIMNEINSKVISPHAGYLILIISDIAKNPDHPKAEEARKCLRKIKNESITPNRAWVLLGKPKKISKKKLEQITDKTASLQLPEEIFNVIVADPQDKYKAMKMQVTEATDAALFLWANEKNISDRLDLMALWGFERKKIAVWDKGTRGGTWFDGAVEFLLLGIKGNWDTPKEKFPIIFRKGDEPDKSNYDLVYEMVEKMFPDQNYLDPFRETGREGWGEPFSLE
jgi:N6-adenosine-specific RNA methylase IME4